MTTAALVAYPKFMALLAGVPAVGCKLFTYIAGTTTKLTTWTTPAANVANANPTILDSRGEANICLESGKIYKFVLAPSTDSDPPVAPIWTVDNISNSANGIYFIQTATGAVAQSIQAILDEEISVFRFMTAAQIADIISFTGAVDCGAAIALADTSVVAALGRNLKFPRGLYNSSIQIAMTADRLGVSWMGEGNASGSLGGTQLKYTGTVNSSLAFILATGAQFIGNSIQNMCINANSRAGYCLNLAAYNASTNSMKQWTFDRVGFNKATRALIVGGDAAYTGTDATGDFDVTAKDSDFHLNVFKRCTFTPMATTRWGYVENVVYNAYQTTFEDFSFEGDASSLAKIENYIRPKQSNGITLINPSFPKIPQDYSLDTATVKIACVRHQQGVFTSYAGECEEARFIYMNSPPTGYSAVTIDALQVNDSSNNADATKKIFINSVGGNRLTVTNCNAAVTSTGLYSRRIIRAANTAGITLLRNNDFGATPTYDNCAPDGEWITYPLGSAYSAGTAYVVGDRVVSASVSYTCILATTGNAPPNVTYWVLTFTATGGAGGTWGVDITGDVVSIKYNLRGTAMTVAWYIQTSTVTGAPEQLLLPIPLGLLSSTGNFYSSAMSRDFGANWIPAFCSVTSGTYNINLFNGLVTTAYTAGANQTYHRGQITFEIA